MSETSNIWYFENVDLFNVLCPTKLSTMEGQHPEMVFDKNEFIYFKDQTSSHIFMISEGRVKISDYTEDGQENVKAILSKGEIFGEMALAGERKTTDFAQALDKNTTVCLMQIEDMHELMAEDQQLSLKIFKLIGLRLRKVERKLESMVFKDSRTRIIDFLRDEAVEKGKKVGYETLIPFHYTHKDIAALTGTSRQTVTTVMNELRDNNLISFDRRRILVRDINAL